MARKRATLNTKNKSRDLGGLTFLRIIVTFLSWLVALGFFPYLAQAEIPQYINYQGKLKDSGGIPITNATTIQFSIYNHPTNGSSTDAASSGGPLLWKETYDQGSGNCIQITPDADGILAQRMGTCVAFPTYLDFTGEYYLGVKIGVDAEAIPRVPLSTYPYAFTAKNLYADNEDVNITTNTSGNIILQTAGNAQLTANNVSTALVINQQGSGDLFEIQDNGVASFVVQDGGYVGIGASTISAQLDIGGGTANFIDGNDDVLIADDMEVDGTVFASSLGDTAGSIGTNGQILTATGTGLQWVDGSALSVDNIYTADGTLTGDRIVTSNGNALTFTGTGGNSIGLRASDAPDTSYININPDEMELRSENATDFADILMNTGGYNMQYGHNGDVNSINISSNMSVSDNINHKGLVYFADYSTNYTNRSLVDKEYVDTHQSTLQQVFDSSIATSGYVEGISGAALYEDDGGAMKIEARAGGYEVALAEEGGSSLYFKSNGGGGNPTEIKFVDGRVAGERYGIEYATDYSADFTNRSLVDKGYVDNHIGALTWQNVVDNQIGGGNYLYVDTISAEFEDDSDQLSILAKPTHSLAFGSLDINFTFDSATHTTQIADQRASGSRSGIEYAADYSADFSNRSLVDKEYVDTALIFTKSGNTVYNGGAPASIATDDFVFGSPTLSYSTEANRMFFDKSKAAFRAGQAGGTEWDGVNVGNYSSAFGRGNTASGFASFVAGQYNQATAFGTLVIGNSSEATGSRALAIGNGAHALGDASIAIGGTRARSFNEVTVGTSYGTSYVPNSTSLWDANDRLFVISNGYDSSNRSDALIFYKSGLSTFYNIASYDADYSGTYTNRSLVDKEYVDGLVSSSGIWTKTGTNLFPSTAGDDVLLNVGETLTISDLTQGSVIFAGAGGLVNQDNAGLFYDDTNNRLGIGTITPEMQLHVIQQAGVNNLENLFKLEVSDATGDFWSVSNSTTSNGSFAPLFIGQNITNSTRTPFTFSARTDTAGDTGTASMYTFDVRNNTPTQIVNRTLFRWTNYTTELMRIDNHGNLGIGNSSPESILHIDSNNANANAILTLENTAGNMQMFRVDTTPETSLTGSIGDLAFDSTGGEVYLKHLGNGTNTGWSRLIRDGSSNSIWDIDHDTGIQTEESADEDIIRFDTAGAERAILDNNGLDIQDKLFVNNIQTVYNAQAEDGLLGTIVLGDGGGNFSHTGGSEAYYNTFIGMGIGVSNTTGYGNTVSGYNALHSNVIGYFNTAFGQEALYSNTGTHNTATGTRTLYTNNSGSHNTANGYVALYSNTTGNRSVAVGNSALYSNTTGDKNTAVGFSTLYANVNGFYNTAIGDSALSTNVSGIENTASGRVALFSNTSGQRNTAYGYAALYDVTDGIGNSAIGHNTGRGITTGDYNTIIGSGVNGLSANLNNNIVIADGQGNQRIRVLSDGKVGMGTTSPLSILHIDSNDGSAGGLMPILTMGNNTDNIQMFVTDATPESVITGSIGDLAFDGTSGDLYLKHSGSSTNTGWLQLATGTGSLLWEDGTNGIFEDDEGVIVGIDQAETLSNTGFALNAGDLFVQDQLGVEGNIYTDGSFIAGATTTLSDGLLTRSTSGDGNLTISTTGGTTGDLQFTPYRNMSVLQDFSRGAGGWSDNLNPLLATGGIAIDPGGQDPHLGGMGYVMLGNYTHALGAGIQNFTAIDAADANPMGSSPTRRAFVGAYENTSSDGVLIHLMALNSSGTGATRIFLQSDGTIDLDATDAISIDTNQTLTLNDINGSLTFSQTSAGMGNDLLNVGTEIFTPTGTIGSTIGAGERSTSLIHAINAVGTYAASLGSGSGAWTRIGTNISPTTAGDDLLLNTGETLSIADMTQGSVSFIGASGLVSQDNTNFFWDDTNNNLGLGTINPGYNLTLVGDGSAPTRGSMELITYADAGAPSGIYFHKAGGTEATPTAITSGMPMGGVVTGGYDGSSMVVYTGGIQMDATENWSNGAHGTRLFFSTTENGTTNMLNRMTIDDNGNVGIGTSNPTTPLHVFKLGQDIPLLTLGNTIGDMQIFTTASNPEGSISGSVGDLAIDNDTTGFMYIKTAGDATNTGWVRFLASDNSITELYDVDTSTNVPTNGQVLAWDGTNWVPNTIAGDTDWSGAGTGTMYATSTTDNIASGTNSPTYTNRGLWVENNGGYSGSIHLRGSTSRLEWYASGNTAGSRAFDTVAYSDALHFRYLDDGFSSGQDYLTLSRANGELSINDSSNDLDFRIEGDTDTNLLFADAGNDAVGIGTNTPRTKLELSGDGSFMATGTYGSGWTEPNLGAGTRMMWYPRKAAFRAGYAWANRWDDANIGNYSVAMGANTMASGEMAIALGYNTIASGIRSFATGQNSTASGAHTTTIGPFMTAGPNNFIVGISLSNTSKTCNQANSMCIMGGNVGIGVSSPTAQLHTTGTVRFATFGAGTLTTDASGNVTASSDERLKNIQGTFNRGLTDLLNINPIEYKWRKKTGYDTESSYYGFSAQNVQLSIPEAIGEDNRGYLTLSDRPILATVVNAIKEQQGMVNKNVLSIDGLNLLAQNQGVEMNSLGDLKNEIDSNSQILTELVARLSSIENRVDSIEDQLIEITDDRQGNFIPENIEGLASFMEESVDDEASPIAKFTGGIWQVAKNVTFGAEAIFEETTVFLGKVTFMDRVTFADKDMAGRATIVEGQKSVKVQFDREFIFAPYVTATVNNDYILFKVSNVTEKEFEIRIKEGVEKDLQFTWHALAVAGKQPVMNDDNEENNDNEELSNVEEDMQERDVLTNEDENKDESEILDDETTQENVENNINNESSEEIDSNNEGELVEDSEIEEDDVSWLVVLESDLGFVRVRQEPTTSSNELTQLNPGEEFIYTDIQTGWYKIEYSQGESGWISGIYTKELEK